MKTNKILLFILIAVSFLSCKENNSKLAEVSNKVKNKAGIMKFPSDCGNCQKNINLCNAIPHIEKYQDYYLKSIGCSAPFGNSIVAQYNHPTEKKYEIKVFIYQELDEHKPMYNTTTANYKMISIAKVNGSDVSDLKIFDNEVLNIKNNSEYFDVSYTATYKKNYSIAVAIRGKDLSTKEKVDAFLRKYLETFKKEELN